nr:DNA-processing protein DprA [Actinomycetota bacterium]
VLVSAGGLDRPYPSAHARLYAEVADHGLLVSESPPGAAPQRHRFLSRNRIIAALSIATVVVEAARRSGALNTAAHAAGLGRSVLAVPGPVTSALSIGCHDLLRRPVDPALLVTGAADVLELLGTASSLTSAADGAGAGVAAVAGAAVADRSTAPRPWDQLDATARAVLDGLPARAWVGEDALARASAVSVPEVMRALPVLRLAGLVESGREGHRLVRTVGRAGGR